MKISSKNYIVIAVSVFFVLALLLSAGVDQGFADPTEELFGKDSQQQHLLFKNDFVRTPTNQGFQKPLSPDSKYPAPGNYKPAPTGLPTKNPVSIPGSGTPVPTTGGSPNSEDTGGVEQGHYMYLENAGELHPCGEQIHGTNLSKQKLSIISANGGKMDFEGYSSNCATPTPTPTPTFTQTPTPTDTPLPTSTNTPLPTATAVATFTSTIMPTSTPTRGSIFTPQPKPVITKTPVALATATPTTATKPPVGQNTPTKPKPTLLVLPTSTPVVVNTAAAPTPTPATRPIFTQVPKQTAISWPTREPMWTTAPKPTVDRGGIVKFY